MPGSSIVKEYAESASVHGISKFGTSKFRRTFWIIAVVICAGALTLFLVMQFIEYSKFRVQTSSRVEIVERLEFPAITVCNLNQVKESVKNCIPGYDLTDFFYEMSEVSDFTSNISTNSSLNNSVSTPNGEQLLECYRNHSHSLKETLLFCQWQGRMAPCDELFESRMTEYGICFTFNGNTSETSRFTNSQGPFSGLHFVLNLQTQNHFFGKTLQTGIKVMVHHRLEEPLPEWRGFLVPPGLSADAIIYQTQKIYLSQPYGDCMDPLTQNPLKRYKFFTKSACVRECYTNYVTSQCGCRSILDPGTEPYCGVQEMFDCFMKAAGNVSNGTASCTQCRTPCRETLYDTSISYASFGSSYTDQYLYTHGVLPDPNTLKKNLIQLRIFYDDLLVSKVEEVPAITIPGIMANLGGYMGLFLGASILSVVELVELVLLLVFASRAERIHNKQNQRETVPREQRKPESESDVLSHPIRLVD